MGSTSRAISESRHDGQLASEPEGEERQFDAVEAIRGAWPQLSDKTIAGLTQAASVVRSEPGPLMSEAELPSHVALVLDGTLVAIWNSPDGRRAWSGLIGPREFFGLSTLGGWPIPGDIDALTDVTLISWVSKEFREIALSDRQMTVDLLDRSIYAIQNAIYGLKMSTFTTARSRLAGLLLRYEAYCFGDPPLVSRGHLGDLAAVSVRMVSSIMRQWEASGIIRRVGSSGLVLLDRAALEARAAPFNEFPPPDPPVWGGALASRPVRRGK